MRIRNVLALGLALAAVAALASTASAELLKRRTAPATRPRVETFTLSGTCTGPIGRDVRVDGVTYRLDPGARIYEIGRGVVPAGASYFDRKVTLTGRKVRGALVVTGVIVRPASWPGAAARPGVMDESAPR